jgi:hypothetical protein
MGDDIARYRTEYHPLTYDVAIVASLVRLTHSKGERGARKSLVQNQPSAHSDEDHGCPVEFSWTRRIALNGVFVGI